MVEDILRFWYRFPADQEHIKVLADAQATWVEVNHALERLARRAKRGDTVVVYFSVHGVRRPERVGRSADNLLLLWNRPLSHTALSRMLARFTEAEVILIIDSCYAGIRAKGLLDVGITKSVPYAEPVPEEPEIELPAYEPQGLISKGVAGGGGGLALRDNIVCLTACAANEEAKAIPLRDEKISVSAFTWALYRCLIANPRIPLEELRTEIELDLRRAGVYHQSPQLWGERVQRTLAPVPEEVPLRSFVPLEKVNAQSAVCGVGTLAGLRQGMCLHLHSPDDRVMRRPLAELRVTSESPMRCEGMATTRVHPSFFAHFPFVRVASPGLWLRVERKGDARSDVWKKFTRGSDERGIAVVPDGVIKVDTTNPDRVEVRFQLADMQEPETVVAASETEAGNLLEDRLSLTMLKRFLERLRNCDPDFHLQLRANHQDGVYRVGDIVEFTLTVDVDCYVTVINVSADGTIAIVFPNRFDRDNRVKGGVPYRIPPRRARDEGFELRATPPFGDDLTIAIATKEPLDLGLPSPDPARGKELFAFVSDSPAEFAGRIFGRGLLSASKGIMVEGTDHAAGDVLLPSDGWATDMVVLHIRE